MGADLLDGGEVQVTTYGGGTAQCKVESWGTQTGNVCCFGPTGALVDTRYDGSWTPTTVTQQLA